MGKWKLCLAAGLMIFLAGCAQQVEREPVSIKDEKAEIDPVKSQEAVSDADTESIKVPPAGKESAKKIGGVKEQLAGITSLEEAPKELIIQETADGKTAEKKLVLQKCDGGFGFYFPEHEDSELAWNLEEEGIEEREEQLFFGGFNTFHNGLGMQMNMICYENSTLDYARKLVSGVDTIVDDSENSYIIQMEMDASDAEECTVGIGEYPAVRTPKLTFPVDYGLTAEGDIYEAENALQAQEEMDDSSQGQMTVQYYFVEIPEGLLRITLNAPAEGMEDSWTETDQILESMIIEDGGTYQDYHSAVSVNAKDRELKFTNLQLLHTFYDTCLVRGDYESAMKVSKNVKTVENGREVWERMECYPSGPTEFLERNNRAVIPCFLIIYDPDDTALPEYQDGEQELLRYMYFIKEGDYWYLDGPLHNEEPTENWWQGEVTSWDVYNYGLSDSKEPGTIITGQEQTTEVMNSWAEKCS